MTKDEVAKALAKISDRQGRVTMQQAIQAIESYESYATQRVTELEAELAQFMRLPKAQRKQRDYSKYYANKETKFLAELKWARENPELVKAAHEEWLATKGKGELPNLQKLSDIDDEGNDDK